MSAQQLNMFPTGEDLPLFSQSPVSVRIEAFEPREEASPSRLFDCPTCQDTGTVVVTNRDKAPAFCLCPAGEKAKMRAVREALPESKHIDHSREMYSGEVGNDDTKVLCETLALDPPEKRIARLGPQALTLIELVSLILGTPTDPIPATHLLAQVKSLAKVKSWSVKELVALGHGITPTRAQRLLAALELTDRIQSAGKDKVRITRPQDAADLLRDMAGLEQEQMRVILLDTKNNVMHIETVYAGSVNTTFIRVAELMRAAVRTNAKAMIIAHNHPSGDPTPSPEDVTATREIGQAAKMLDIDLLDHVVIGESGRFVSLKEHGLGFV